MDVLKKVIINTGAQVVGKGITASITLLITYIIARTLKEEGYGDFTKIFVFVGYFYTLADFGLNQIYIKVAQENKTDHLKILFGLRLIMGLTLAIVCSAVAFALPFNEQSGTGFSPIVKVGIVIASITIITQALFTSANAFFQKILRYDLSTIAAATSYAFVLITAIIVSTTTKSLLGYTAAYVVGGFVLVTTAYLVISKRTKAVFVPTFKKQEFSKFLVPAWPIGLALIFNLIYFRIDVLILSLYQPSQEVGTYGLAYQFFEAALALPIFFANSIYPLLQNLYNTNLQEFKVEFKNWARNLLAVSLLLTVAVYLISFLIPIIYKNHFTGSTQALQILALGFPFFFISALLWHVLIIYNRQKLLWPIYATGAILNIGANLVFIPKHGYMAAAAITVVSEALIMLLLTIAVLKQRRNP